MRSTSVFNNLGRNAQAHLTEQKKAGATLLMKNVIHRPLEKKESKGPLALLSEHRPPTITKVFDSLSLIKDI